jgi:hypothetical protein
MARRPCFLCTHWVEDAVIGEAEARRLLAAHKRKRAEHGGYGSVATLPPSQAETAAKPALKEEGRRHFLAAICRTCRQLPCACPQDVIAAPTKPGFLDLAFRLDNGITIDIHVPVGARIAESDYAALTDVLSVLVRKEPVQTPGQEGEA